MALKKTLSQRLLTNITCRLSTPSSAVLRPPPANLASASGDDVIFRRIHQSTAAIISPAAAGLLKSLRGMDFARDRIRLDGLIPPLEKSPETSPENFPAEADEGLTVEEARKVLRVSQLQGIKKRLKEIRKDSVFFEEFLDVCCEGCGSREMGLGFAKMLDESGHVIVLGNHVFLRPEQVVKIVQSLMPSPVSHPNDPRWKELKNMEKRKRAIDQKAELLVRRELWCGLGYLMLQTAVFMRLTFWELTWDVMEPICFYVTSAYFMAGYAFFLRTKIEPSFEGLFLSRFNAKQKRLMKMFDFDEKRYNEHLRAFHPSKSLPGNASLHDGLSSEF